MPKPAAMPSERIAFAPPCVVKAAMPQKPVKKKPNVPTTSAARRFGSAMGMRAPSVDLAARRAGTRVVFAFADDSHSRRRGFGDRIVFRGIACARRRLSAAAQTTPARIRAAAGASTRRPADVAAGHVECSPWSTGTWAPMRSLATEIVPAARLVVEPPDCARVSASSTLDEAPGTRRSWRRLLGRARHRRGPGSAAARRGRRRGADAGARRDVPARGRHRAAPPDACADVVLSVFGVLFAPDARAAIAEMARIAAPGARIVLTAWLPVGAMSDARDARARALAPAAHPRSRGTTPRHSPRHCARTGSRSTATRRNCTSRGARRPTTST